VLPTPLVRAHRLEAALGCGPLLVKRDDLAGFAVAGNKSRPLEYVLGAARAQGADILVTGGGPSSNFCPAAALAARVAGLDCELVIWGDPGAPPNLASPNLDLAVAAGARLRPTGNGDRDAVDDAVAARAIELAAAGRRPFAVPRGGSTGLGAVGFAVAVAELADGLRAAGQGRPALLVLAVGSGGSCAGLLAGLAAGGLDWPVLGVSVSRPPDSIASRVVQLAWECAGLLGTPAPRPGQLELVDARGSFFGAVSTRERTYARLALHTEGLLLDDTYGAKAFAVLVDRLADARGPVVYWHTGGLLPAIGALREQRPVTRCEEGVA
jgi:1-aminocyclopropane-1-carboxylate deaminase/D-cysteine desulfhydrase-like pyridoxal-dependent ACC family enzyme